jgi:hypothetical protein
MQLSGRCGDRLLIEYDDAARDLTRKQRREPFIYLIEPIDPADQVIEVDFLLEIQIGEHRKIDSRPHRAVISAADHLFATPSEKGLSASSGESWDPDQHRLPAGCDRIDHLQRGLFAADRVEPRV